MPTDVKWTGTVSSDPTVAGNWSPGLPVSGDRVFLVEIASGANDIGGGDLSAVDPAALFCTPGYTGDIASSNGSLIFGTVTDLVFASGGSRAWLDATAITTATIAGGQPGDDMLHLNTAVTLLQAIESAGKVTLADGSALTQLQIGPGANLDVVVGSSVTGFTLAEIDAGRVEFGTIAPTMRLRGNSRGIVVPGAGNITTLLDIRGQSVCEYNGDGDLTLLVVAGPQGLFDFTNNRVAGNITCTDRTLWTGGTMDLRNGQQNFVMTNPTKLLGGVPRYDYGSEAA